MNRNMSPRRRRLVIVCAAIAASSGIMGMLLHGHPVLRVVWLAVILGALIYAVTEFARMSREEQ